MATLHVEFYEANSLRDSVASVMVLSWVLPAAICIKVNVNDGLSVANKRAGIGIVVRNDIGLSMATATIPFLSLCEPLLVKFMAIFEALRFYIDVVFHNGELVSNYLSAVQLIRNSSDYYGSSCFILQDIRNLLSCNVSFSISHASREANQVAHVLAQHALTIPSVGTWMEVGPK